VVFNLQFSSPLTIKTIVMFCNRIINKFHLEILFVPEILCKPTIETTIITVSNFNNWGRGGLGGSYFASLRIVLVPTLCYRQCFLV